MNESQSEQKILQQSVLEEPDGSPMTTANVIQLDNVLINGGLNALSKPNEPLVQGFYTPEQVAKDVENRHSPEFFSEKMARLIGDAFFENSSVLNSRNCDTGKRRVKDLNLPNIHNFAKPILRCKILLKLFIPFCLCRGTIHICSMIKYFLNFFCITHRF